MILKQSVFLSPVAPLIRLVEVCGRRRRDRAWVLFFSMKLLWRLLPASIRARIPYDAKEASESKGDIRSLREPRELVPPEGNGLAGLPPVNVGRRKAPEEKWGTRPPSAYTELISLPG
jgi:hypothetical protein